VFCQTGINAQTISVHDPVLISEDSTYYIFCTGFGISVWSSHDLKNWKHEPPVFYTSPLWVSSAIPGFDNHIWAPDISYHDNQYYLYYSISSFGKNNSCIGLATNLVLNPKDPKYHWIDRGIIVQSIPGRDLWNAIDPNLIIDENHSPWLTFGSFWSGIKLVKLDTNLKDLASPQEWISIAKRPRDYYAEDTIPGEGAIEAPFIFRKDGFYYLFVSVDYCCRGVNSNYKIMVGRSKRIKGPYLDKNGVSLNQNGGTIIQQGSENYSGTGHCAVYAINGADYIVYHAYNISQNGRPELVIKRITLDMEGWPLIIE